MKNLIPILEWLPKYKKSYLKGDLFAGITVGVVLISQGLAYALIAGLPPQYGLYAALVPQVLYAIFGTTHRLSVGPVALDSLIVAAGIASISAIGNFNPVIIAIQLALLTGVIQLFLGVIQFGFLVNFLSKPVISGFTSAAAILIGLNQVKYLTGVAIKGSNSAYYLFQELITKISGLNIQTLIVSCCAVIFLVVLNKLLKSFPSSLILVVITVLLTQFVEVQPYGIDVIGELPQGLPSFKLQSFQLSELKHLLPVALTLALVGYVEAISISKSIEERKNESNMRPNQELVALGFGNIVGSMFGAYSSTAGFSRSAVNVQSGAITNLASLISAIVVGVVLLTLTPLFHQIPKAILAAIIVVALANLVNVKYPIKLWSYKKDDFLVLIITFLSTLFLGIIEGIGVGVVLSIVLLVYRSTKPHIAELGNIEGTQYFRNIKRFKKAAQHPDILIFRFDGQLYFANAGYFHKKLMQMVKRKGYKLQCVILDAEAINNIDSTAVAILSKIIVDFSKKGVRFLIADATGPVRDILHASGLIELMGENSLFMRNADALAYYEQLRDNGTDNYKYKDIAGQNFTD